MNPYPVTSGSLAPNLADRQSIPQEVVRAAIQEKPVPHQKSLFPQPVLAFPGGATPRSRGRRQPSRSGSQSVRRTPRKLERLEAAGQQRLELETSAPLIALATESGVQSARYCTQAVAIPTHRLIAAALDFGLVATGLGMFFALFHYLGGAGVVGALSTSVSLAIALGILVFYKALWWLANGDTPGMEWCRLRLLDFTGRRPTRKQRAQRFAGTCLSLAAAGLGLLWALGDEEKLCWNDHLSKTFPSPKADER
jgi:uncharacterized RDD family membrane protein YckC